MSIRTKDEYDRISYEKVGRIYNAYIRDVPEIFLEKLLQTEGDINYEISDGSGRVSSLLHTDTFQTNLQLIKLLLKYGADYMIKDREDRTFLLKIIQEKIFNSGTTQSRDYEYIDLLLTEQVKRNDPANPSDKNGITHFHVACMRGNTAAVEFFLKNGVDANLATNALDTPLTAALSCVDVVEILLKHGANPNLKNKRGLSPLHAVIARIIGERMVRGRKSSSVEILKRMVLLSNDHTNIDDFGFHDLHIACILQDESSIENVLERTEHIDRPVNFDSPFYPGFTALHFAAFFDVQIVNLLLKKGANILAKNEKGVTPLDLCLRHYNAAAIHSILSTREEWKSIVLSDNETKLIDAVAAMNSQDGFVSFLNSNRSALTAFVPFDSPLCAGYTMLHLAVALSKAQGRSTSYDSTIIEECLKRGADATVKDAEGTTALHLAFHSFKCNVVRLLLDYHDKPENPIDKNNLSHLHIACAAGHQRAVEHLLSNGSIDVTSPTSKTFARVAYLGDSYEVLLPPGSTALHMSAAHGSEDITRMLLARGADVCAQDATGFTPVHRLLPPASFRRGDRIHESLLSLDNLEDRTTQRGLGHLHVACYFKDFEAIDRLLELGADAGATLSEEPNLGRDIECSRDLLSSSRDYDESLAFLSSYSGYSPLDFLWRERERVDRHEYERLVRASFALIERSARDIGRIAYLHGVMSRDDRLDEFYEMLSESVALKTRLEEELGITSLHLACCLGDVESVERSIASGANVNARVDSKSTLWRGYTPLHCTALRAREKYRDGGFVDRLARIARLLTDNGADPLAVDDENDTPLHLVARNRNDLSKLAAFVSSVFEGMSKFGVDATNNEGISLLHIACATQNIVMIEKLLERGADVNRAISHFSNFHPGSTALHLAIRCRRPSENLLCKFGLRDDVAPRIVDALIRHGAKVDATDAFGDTPLSVSVELKALRRILTSKLITNGADVHAMNVKGVTAFESLLRQENASWEEIEIFLKAGCHFNVYNPITEQGYMAMAFRCHLKNIDNRAFQRIINNPQVKEIDDAGRTAVHNVVSIDFYNCGFSYRGIDMDAAGEACAQVIEKIAKRGCDVDRQDDDGNTALHLALSFGNYAGVLGLLRNGVDVNLADDGGKTIFSQFSPDDYPDSLTELLAMHVYKLEFCGHYLNEQKESVDLGEEYLMRKRRCEMDRFHKEVKKATNVKIGNTSVSVRGFLMGTRDADIDRMTKEERMQVGKFFENNKHDFQEIGGLLKLKHRRIGERSKLMGPALACLNFVTNGQLTPRSSEIVLRYLTNEDLKRVIASLP